MSTEENNKLIAEFMGWTFFPREDYNTYSCKFNGAASWDIITNKDFSTGGCFSYEDWNSIMPVVEKIESIYDDFHGYFGVYISSNQCTIEGTKLRTDFQNFHPAYHNGIYGETKLEATYAAVIEFIKWYNENK